MCFCVYNIICIVWVCVCACVCESVSLYVFLCVRLRCVCVRRAGVVYTLYIYELWCVRMVCISVNCRWVSWMVCAAPGLGARIAGVRHVVVTANGMWGFRRCALWDLVWCMPLMRPRLFLAVVYLIVSVC